MIMGGGFTTLPTSKPTATDSPVNPTARLLVRDDPNQGLQEGDLFRRPNGGGALRTDYVYKHDPTKLLVARSPRASALVSEYMANPQQVPPPLPPRPLPVQEALHVLEGMHERHREEEAEDERAARLPKHLHQPPSPRRSPRQRALPPRRKPRVPSEDAGTTIEDVLLKRQTEAAHAEAKQARENLRQWRQRDLQPQQLSPRQRDVKAFEAAEQWRQQRQQQQQPPQQQPDPMNLVLTPSPQWRRPQPLAQPEPAVLSPSAEAAGQYPPPWHPWAAPTPPEVLGSGEGSRTSRSSGLSGGAASGGSSFNGGASPGSLNGGVPPEWLRSLRQRHAALDAIESRRKDLGDADDNPYHLGFGFR